MSIVSNNIKYLRRLNGLTQEQFARKIAIKRSLLGAYEEARANPNLTNLKNMASAFGISVDQLLKNDLRKLRETPDMSLPINASRQMTVSHSGSVPAPARMPAYSEPQPLSKIIDKYQQPKQEIRTVSRQVNLKPVNGNVYQPVNASRASTKPVEQPVRAAISDNAAISHQTAPQLPIFNNQYAPVGQSVQATKSLDNANYPTVQWVGKNMWKEYIANCQNPAFLNQLPSFQIPNLPSGYYRAFESGTDFVYPGSLLIGTFIRNWYEIQNGTHYVFVLHNQGVLYRQAFNRVKEKGVLVLVADIPSIPNVEIALQEVLEVWEIKAFISLQMPAHQPSVEKIGHLVEEIQKELKQNR